MRFDDILNDDETVGEINAKAAAKQAEIDAAKGIYPMAMPDDTIYYMTWKRVDDVENIETKKQINEQNCKVKEQEYQLEGIQPVGELDDRVFFVDITYPTVSEVMQDCIAQDDIQIGSLVNIVEPEVNKNERQYTSEALQKAVEEKNTKNVSTIPFSIEELDAMWRNIEGKYIDEEERDMIRAANKREFKNNWDVFKDPQFQKDLEELSKIDVFAELEKAAHQELENGYNKRMVDKMRRCCDVDKIQKIIDEE